jgi:hypothetical protein
MSYTAIILEVCYAPINALHEADRALRAKDVAIDAKRLLAPRPVRVGDVITIRPVSK